MFSYYIKEEKKESCSSLSKLDFFKEKKARSFWRIITIHNRCYLLRYSIHTGDPRSPGFWWFGCFIGQQLPRG
jgi:hypothetical protein